MNANELAEELYDLDVQASQQSLNDWAEQAATMLRQQQAKIEALKDELKRYADALGEERGNKALKNHEIAAVLTQVLDDCGLLRKAQENG